MKNIKTKFAVIFLGVLLCVPAVIVRADDVTSTSTPDTTPPAVLQFRLQKGQHILMRERRPVTPSTATSLLKSW